ncbi:hypothetical protein LR48_Vigan09g128100 [Vigna angularis]|uniref:Uncharacterized protein n=1 Tax=Phaseolus angularis TaxID=3914 RepID=A0A0L9VCH9_PHAAN|nr:hypothetical protein LR48_Vigan09g128100 [Vigna angularis]
MLSSFFHPATQFRLRVAAAPTFVGETKTRSGTLLAGVPPVELFANPIRDPTSEHDIFASSFLAYSMFAFFIGNPGLCGYWLDSSCQGSHPTKRGQLNFLAEYHVAPSHFCFMVI